MVRTNDGASMPVKEAQGLPLVIAREMACGAERLRAFRRLPEPVKDRHQIDVGEAKLIAGEMARRGDAERQQLRERHRIHALRFRRRGLHCRVDHTGSTAPCARAAPQPAATMRMPAKSLKAADRVPDIGASLEASVSTIGGRQFAAKRPDVNAD